MMRYLCVGAILLSAMNAAPAVAQTAPLTQKQEPANGSDIVVTKKVPSEDKRVCRREMQTGSIFSKVVCTSKREDELFRERNLAARDQVEKLREVRKRVQIERGSGP